VDKAEVAVIEPPARGAGEAAKRCRPSAGRDRLEPFTAAMRAHEPPGRELSVATRLFVLAVISNTGHAVMVARPVGVRPVPEVLGYLDLWPLPPSALIAATGLAGSDQWRRMVGLSALPAGGSSRYRRDQLPDDDL